MSEDIVFGVIAFVVIGLVLFVRLISLIARFMTFCFIRGHSNPTADANKRECPKCLRKSSYDICCKCGMYTLPIGEQK